MSVNISSFAGAGWQFFDNSGNVLTGGKLFTYAAGTTTPKVTYTSSTGLTANANPIILDASGRVSNEIWLIRDDLYKFILTDANDVLIGSWDNIPGISTFTALTATDILFSGKMDGGANPSISNTWTNYIAPTIMYSDEPAVAGFHEGTISNPNSTNNDPVLWVQKFTDRVAGSATEHNPGGILAEVISVGSGSDTAPTTGTWVGILGNTVFDNSNVGTSGSPKTDLVGNSIGVAGFARANFPTNGIIAALWGYAQTPTMTDVEFNNWPNSFVTTALELNLDIEHKDPGAKAIVAGKGTTVGMYMMNYQESAIQRNLSFGIAFNASPLTGYPNTDPDIDHWHGFHTGILLDKIQTQGILFGQYFKNGSYGIKFPDTWLTQEPAAAIYLGNSKINMGQYVGTNYIDNDVWHNAGKLFFRSAGVNRTIVDASNNIFNITSGVFRNFASSASLTLQRANGTSSSPTAVLLNEQLGALFFTGYDGTSFVSNATMESYPAENWSSTNRGQFTVFSTTPIGSTTRSTALILQASGNVTPGTDGLRDLGNASLRWSTVYATTGTINTSDGREKQQIRELTFAEKNVAVKLKKLIKAFKFNDAVALKGDGARVHFGAIAQEVKSTFEEEGLDANEYGLLCYDSWEDTPEIKDENEIVIRKAIPKGDRFGLRYDQLLMFIVSQT